MDLVSWTFGGNLPDPDKPILIEASSPNTSYSYNQLRTKTRQLIAGLRENGVQPGDCVCVNCFNDLDYSVLYLGIIGSGAVFTGVNPSFTPNELQHHFALTKATLLIVEPAMLAKTLAAAEQAGISTDRIYVFDTNTENPRPEFPGWNSLLEHGESDWVTVQDPHETVATYNSTSGTSGLPKAAMLSHSYHVSAAAYICPRDTEYPHTRLLTLPPFHSFGSPVLPSSIRQGIPTYVMRRFAEAPFISAIAQYSITETWVAPPVLMCMPKSTLATRESFDSLRIIWSGGASVRFAQQKPLYDLLHEDARIRMTWGMTETGWITCIQDRTRREDDSVGQPVKGCEVRIVDEAGEPITADRVSGELLAQVPHPLLAYIANPVASAEAFTPCRTYLRTGDIGYRVTDPATGIPSFFIVDRAKELIKVRGWQVSPSEVESELLQHPAIADAAVIGIKEDDGVGEFVRAYIVRKTIPCDADADTDPDDAALRAWLRQRLASYKIPAEFVALSAVPRNGTGKILRRVLREVSQAPSPVTPSKATHGRVDSAVISSKAVAGMLSHMGGAEHPLANNPVAVSATTTAAAPPSAGHALATVPSQVEMAPAVAETPETADTPEHASTTTTPSPPSQPERISSSSSASFSTENVDTKDNEEKKKKKKTSASSVLRQKLKELVDSSKESKLVTCAAAGWTRSLQGLKRGFGRA